MTNDHLVANQWSVDKVDKECITWGQKIKWRYLKKKEEEELQNLFYLKEKMKKKLSVLFQKWKLMLNRAKNKKQRININ